MTPLDAYVTYNYLLPLVYIKQCLCNHTEDFVFYKAIRAHDLDQLHVNCTNTVLLYDLHIMF